tara:strand:+ start:44 stop:583 length:540 start_codon:yes stop_codon:yes gene_type:complete
MYNLYKPFDFLSKDECQEIINYGQTHETEDGVVGERKAFFEKDKRQGKVCWCNIKKYKDKILEVFKTFNKNLYIDEDLQITFYKQNDFYTWHKDTFRESEGMPRQRLLSIVVELQPASQAGLFLDSTVYPFIPRNEDFTIKLKQGQAFVFPSNDMHMARNLGPKERISLVAWGSKLTKH